MLRAQGLTKIYPAVAGSGGTGGDGGRGEVVLFRGLDLSVAAGEMVAIVGESGSGKSSLLHLLAALDRPTEGDVWVAETRLGGLNARQAAEFRNREVGYVWQFHYLLPEFTAVENVAMPLLARGVRRTEALEKARAWLGEVGLAPVGRAKRRRTAAGEPGASTGNRAKAVAGGRADGGPGREDGGGGVWADPEAAWGASTNQRAGDAQHGVCDAMRAGPAVAGWGTSYRSGCCA